MSTFTQFNGPMGHYGPSAKDITQLIDAYNELNALLNRHINETANATGSTVHAVRAYVEEAISTLNTAIATKADSTKLGNIAIQPIDGTQVNNAIEAINKLNDYLNGFVKSSTLDNYVTKDLIPNNTTTSNKLQNKADIDNAIDALDLPQYATNDHVDTVIADTVASLDNTNDPFPELLAEVIKATKKLVGRITAFDNIDFTKWTQFAAPFAGTGALETTTNGAYILGCISTDWSDDNEAPDAAHAHKAGRAFVKYVNTAPFDAIIDFTATKTADGYVGAIHAQVTKKAGTWEELAFHLLLGTNSQSKETVYVAVSAKGLAYTDTQYSNTYFRACGINFIPVSGVNYVMPSGMLECLDTAYIGGEASSVTSLGNIASGTISANEYSTADGDVLVKIVEKQDPTDKSKKFKQAFIGDPAIDKFTFVKRPTMLVEDPDTGELFETEFITYKDLVNVIMPVGAIIRWAPEDAEGHLTKVPDGWLDISNPQTVAKDDYPELAELLGVDAMGNIKMPIETHSIIKAKYIDVTELIAQPDYDKIADYESVLTAVEELDERVDDFEGKVEAETDRATAAEEALDNRMDTFETAVDNERVRAMAAESTLRNDISSEVTRAEAAEKSLDNKIKYYHPES